MLKSAFSIIDEMFQQEIEIARQKDKRICSSCCYEKPISPSESNEFIKNILNPFAHYKEKQEERELENILNQKQQTVGLDKRRLSILRSTYKKQMRQINYYDLHGQKIPKTKCCFWFS
jgi:hypothetical protein